MWKCPACQADVEDSLRQCPQCGYTQTQPTTRPATPAVVVPPVSEDKVTWPYSGKAFRARIIFNCLLTVLFVALGVYLTMIQKWGDSKVVWGIVAVILAVDWFWFYGNYWYKTNCIRYRLAEAHLYFEHGFFRRTVDTMELIGIADLRMQQTLWDRFINGGVGMVEVFSVSDKTNETLKMNGLENPQEVLEKIDNARRRLRGRGIVQM
ncbi:MAG: PH domain-containing protein [Planctomycetaceae bacterium]|nr:PH domain-containing protein [Planctomycetaceae bacterium]